MKNHPRGNYLIGCNIRTGQTPGSFTKHFTTSMNSNKPRRRSTVTTVAQVREAAMTVLERRGFINEPNQNDSTVRRVRRIAI